MNTTSNYKLKFNVNFNGNQTSHNILIDQQVFSKLVISSSQYISSKNSNTITISNNFFDNSTIVQDEERYYIQISNNGFKKTRINISKNYSNIPKIVLLLESPHKSEYQSKNSNSTLTPVGPAQGTNPLSAGGAIDKYLEQAINYIRNRNHGIPVNGDYVLVIANPVQFQTSLHFIHNQSLYNNKSFQNLRDDVWRKIWNIKQVKNDFKSRLDGYNPYLIINACTDRLKNDVGSYVFKNTNYMIVDITHPSYNWSNNNFN